MLWCFCCFVTASREAPPTKRVERNVLLNELYGERKKYHHLTLWIVQAIFCFVVLFFFTLNKRNFKLANDCLLRNSTDNYDFRKRYTQIIRDGDGRTRIFLRD